MDRAEAEDTLRKALAMALGRDNLDILEHGPEGQAIRLSELGVDSLAIIELGITLEYEFGVEVNPAGLTLLPESSYESLLANYLKALELE